MAQIERHNRQLARQQGIAKHLVGGLGVDDNVELGKGGDVADARPAVDLAEGRAGEVGADGAAHETQALDVRREVRVRAEQGANVGEGARGNEPCGVGRLRAESGGHGVDGRDGRGLHVRDGQ